MVPQPGRRPWAGSGVCDEPATYKVGTPKGRGVLLNYGGTEVSPCRITDEIEQYSGSLIKDSFETRLETMTSNGALEVIWTP